MMRDGTWWLSSDSDPRWNSDGRGPVGLFGMPDGAKRKLEELKKELGDPPKDLEWGYMKD